MDAGYLVAYAVAEDNLRIGRTVIADSVNPLQLTRDAWVEVAKRAQVNVVEIEVKCSEVSEHRRRVETRSTDIPGLRLPTWDEVVSREYHPWGRERLVIETAGQTVEQTVKMLREALPGQTVTHPNKQGEDSMKITDLLLAELDREAVRIRKVLERIPEGKNDWKPHEKSMPLGYLATIVATIPAWLDMVVNMDELDINPPGGPGHRPPQWKTRSELLAQFESSLQKGREVLQNTTDDRLLNTKWRMLAAGKLMSEQLRYVAIRDGVLNHMAHHRGQLTVYLRLNEEKVPAIYGPSADEGKE